MGYMSSDRPRLISWLRLIRTRPKCVPNQRADLCRWRKTRRTSAANPWLCTVEIGEPCRNSCGGTFRGTGVAGLAYVNPKVPLSSFHPISSSEQCSRTFSQLPRVGPTTGVPIFGFNTRLKRTLRHLSLANLRLAELAHHFSIGARTHGLLMGESWSRVIRICVSWCLVTRNSRFSIRTFVATDG
jgi:hypothetical protein